jgi:medium-chain acyl-[acyl-carrier-protein] hydrolase
VLTQRRNGATKRRKVFTPDIYRCAAASLREHSFVCSDCRRSLNNVMTVSTSNPWLENYKPNPEARTRLFCFPYAGGSARIYHTWPQRVPRFVEVCAVQLPGRDRRISEPPFSNVELLVREIADALRDYFDKPFAFFGHSIGALVSFELAHYLSENLGVAPVHIAASGRRAPHLPKEPPIYDLPREQLIEKLRELAGTPPEVLDHPELLNLLLPLLRADFAVGDTYVFTDRPPLSCSITALGGLQDTTVPPRDLEAWKELTTGAFELRMYPGDHFFVHSDEIDLRDVLGQEFLKLSNPPSTGPTH